MFMAPVYHATLGHFERQRQADLAKVQRGLTRSFFGLSQLARYDWSTVAGEWPAKIFSQAPCPISGASSIRNSRSTPWRREAGQSAALSRYCLTVSSIRSISKSHNACREGRWSTFRAFQVL